MYRRSRAVPAIPYTLLYFVTLLLAALLPWQERAEAASADEAAASPAALATAAAGSPEERIATLSDQEVRRLLLTELAKEKAAPGEDQREEDVQGPGALIGEILTSLSGQATSLSTNAQRFFQKIPEVPADLYKVFITL